jgi:transposase
MGSVRKSQLSKAKQDRLIEHFVAGATARFADDLVRVNLKTAIYYFHRLRKIISYHFEQEADTFFSEEIEVGESYFGGKRKGKRGRGAVGKVGMFGILRRRGKVYTKGYSRCFISNIIPHY